MSSILLRTRIYAVEIAVIVLLLALCGLIIYDAFDLGPGWGEQGPEPGFFPFALTLLVIVGAIGVLVSTYNAPNRLTFFEAPQEIEDLFKVGIPIMIAGAIMPWTGLYVSAGLYTAFFMAWYGKFRWYEALAGGVLLPLLLWATLRQGFNIPMPMSVFYRSGYLPF